MWFSTKTVIAFILPSGKVKQITSYVLLETETDLYADAEYIIMAHNVKHEHCSLEEISKYGLSAFYPHDGENYYLIVIEVPIFDEKSHKDKPMKMAFIVQADDDYQARAYFVEKFKEGVPYTIKQIKETAFSLVIPK